MPMPPPPAELFSITGKPTRRASRQRVFDARRATRCRAAAARPALAASSRAVCLQPEGAYLLRGRADEGDALRLRGLREVGVLAQEAVARVDGLRRRCARRVEHGAGIQVAVLGGRRPDADRASASSTWRAWRSASEYTATERMPMFPQGAADAAGDFAAVGDQDALEHGQLCALWVSHASAGNEEARGPEPLRELTGLGRGHPRRGSFLRGQTPDDSGPRASQFLAPAWVWNMGRSSTKLRLPRSRPRAGWGSGRRRCRGC